MREPVGPPGPGGRRTAAGGGPDQGRTAELAAALAATTRRIEAAAEAAGRDPADLTLIAVSKTWPAADVVRLAGLGVADFGENRDQDAAPKAAAVAAALAGTPPRWHFVGRLQRNKARSVASYADWVHSVDRPELATALSRAAADAGREPTALIQVSLDGAQGRGGVAPDDVRELADLVADAPGLRLGGVMAVAPLGVPPRPAFDLLREVSEALRRIHPGALVISAGMSGDLEAAIAAGATHLRVGTALFGARPPVA